MPQWDGTQWVRTAQEIEALLDSGWKRCACGRVFWFPQGAQCVECRMKEKK